MNWHITSRASETSDCGCYEIKHSRDPHRGDFYNAWHVPTGKHVDADRQREVVRKSCERHAAKQLDLVP